MKKQQELKFYKLEWTKGPYYNEEVEFIRKEMIKKNVSLKEMAIHMMFTIQHTSCCLRGKYKLTKRNKQLMVKFLESKPELNDVVL